MKSIIFKHPFTKLLSFGLAAFLWFMVHGEKHNEISVDVPIEVADLPENLIIANEFDDKINLRIAGPRTLVQQIAKDGLKPHVLNLADARQGGLTFSVYEDDFDIPKRTRIRRITPHLIRLNLDRAEERLVKIVPKFVGSLEEGFELGRQQVDPRFVKVRGPAREMARLSALRTEPINLAGRQSSFEGVYNLRTESPIWKLETKSATVEVRIEEKEVAKLIEDVPVVVAGASGRVEVAPAKVALKARGPAGRIALLREEIVEVAVDVSGLDFSKAKNRSLRVRPVPPQRPGIVIKLIPDNVRVTLVD